MSKWPMVPLNRVLTEDREVVQVEPTWRYRTAGIYSYGRGLFWRPEITGTETSYKSYVRLRTNNFVFSKLFAWEGAISIVPESFDGALVSSEFPAYVIDTDQLDPGYLGFYVRREDFYRSLVTNGMGDRRQRVNPAAMLSAHMPLPSLPEQRRIAHWLSKVEAKYVSTLDVTSSTRTTRMMFLSRAAIDGALGGLTGGRTVGDVVSIIGDVVRPGEDPSPARSFVGLEHIAPNLGMRVGSKAVGGEKGRKLRFRPRDILYGYLRPYQNKVWLADIDGLCSVEQYVLRANEPDDAEIVSQILRGAGIYDRVVAASNNLQLPRLGSSTLLSLDVPWPKTKSERDEVIVRLRHVKAVSVHVDDIQRRQEAASRALLPAALNQVFGSLN